MSMNGCDACLMDGQDCVWFGFLGVAAFGKKFLASPANSSAAAAAASWPANRAKGYNSWAVIHFSALLCHSMHAACVCECERSNVERRASILWPLSSLRESAIDVFHIR